MSEVGNAIKVVNLTKSYHSKTVVSGLNLSVKSGTVFGLLGANGAGKSTTIECVLGTKRAEHGTVSVILLKTDAVYFRGSAFSFKRVIISRKLKFLSFVRKQRVCT